MSGRLWIIKISIIRCYVPFTPFFTFCANMNEIIMNLSILTNQHRQFLDSHPSYISLEEITNFETLTIYKKFIKNFGTRNKFFLPMCGIVTFNETSLKAGINFS